MASTQEREEKGKEGVGTRRQLIRQPRPILPVAWQGGDGFCRTRVAVTSLAECHVIAAVVIFSLSQGRREGGASKLHVRVDPPPPFPFYTPPLPTPPSPVHPPPTYNQPCHRDRRMLVVFYHFLVWLEFRHHRVTCYCSSGAEV